jgi:divalent metal cation (Fe/Co/Zn/Cd) transporter
MRNGVSVTTERVNAAQYFKLAFALALFTICYNLIEGAVSVYFGFEDESLTLFGFGVDSFIEVISGIGVAHMIFRIKSSPDSHRDDFQRTALKVTGSAFYILVVGLIVTGVYNIWNNHNPEATFWGIIISIISILIMWALILGKTKAGRALNSPAILADAQCTKVCIYMSIILLASSLIYSVARIPYIDSIGSLVLAYFSFKEGRECFEKAASNNVCGCDHRC